METRLFENVQNILDVMHSNDKVQTKSSYIPDPRVVKRNSQGEEREELVVSSQPPDRSIYRPNPVRSTNIGKLN